MKRDKNHLFAGFTLIEIVVVLAIVAIFISIAVPSTASFLNAANQKKRMDIARTIYLAAQNQLTELTITKNLKSDLTSEYYDYDDGVYTENTSELENTNNVFDQLDDFFPDGEIDNQNYIHFISKAAGDTDPDNPVIKLLDQVILDKEILNDAILIEFNIETGVVFSVFYGDMLADGVEFTYSDEGNDSVKGSRGMGSDGYEFASVRKQGFYGVGATGRIDDGSNDLLPVSVNVYDSYSRPLPDSACKNALYAEILIPQRQLASDWDLYINDYMSESEVELDSLPNDKNLDYALEYSASTDPLIYRYDGNINDGVDAALQYARIIWVIDYVGGNMTESTSDTNIEHSIGVKYADQFAENKNFRITIQGSSLTMTSFTQAHPYFFTKNSYSGNSYEIRSARHLYNIRYLEDGNFMQKTDIDLADVENFEPIPEFKGTYIGMEASGSAGYVIKNLTIELPDENNVGLFGVIKNNSSKSSITGLSLDNPSVIGDDNVGSVCGELQGFITGIYVSYNNDAKIIDGSSNVGGIVGVNNGSLTDSTFISSTKAEHIVGGDKSKTGGIVGENGASATLKRILFLALAPKDTANTKINPIAGNSHASAKLDNLYYLSGTAVRPEDLDPPDYNSATSNGIGDGLGTLELYSETMSSSWLKNEALTEEEIISLTNTKYPYQYSKYSTAITEKQSNWPIVEGGIVIAKSNIAYYELYGDECGLWIIVDDEIIVDGEIIEIETIIDSLKYDMPITETGYVIILDEKPPADYNLFARGGTVGANEPWTSGDHIDAMDMDSFENATDFSRAVAKLAEVNEDKAWVYKIPLNELYPFAEESIPLQMMYSKNDTGVGPKKIPLLIQPLFAKGLYSYIDNGPSPVAPDPEEFFIRTPWHMQNISTLISGSENYTDAKIFTQEVSIDFESAGIGVEVDKHGLTYLTEPVVAGEFKGIYNGGGNAVSNVVIKAPMDDENYTNDDEIGLFSRNNGVIQNLSLRTSQITGDTYVGGIAGYNDNRIELSSVEHSFVIGNDFVGGITGYNQNTIEDVFLLSSEDVDSDTPPVSHTGGGIAGYNANMINRALYLASAPAPGDPGTSFYPITRNQDAGAAVKKSFYLSGSRYSINNGNEPWINMPYNYAATSDPPVPGEYEVTGAITDFITDYYLNYIYHAEFTNWTQLSRGYPYPVFRNSKTAPTLWPEVQSPYRAAQLDRKVEEGDVWDDMLPTSNRALNLDFINGDFELPLMNPNNPSQIQYISATPAPAGDNFITLTSGAAYSKHNNMGGSYIHDWIQGWNTRPTDPSKVGTSYWNAIEFQNVNTTGKNGRTKTNYRNQTTGLYAELNAEMPGTLYQICATVPGTDMYYSFHHSTRQNPSATTPPDEMFFFLSGMESVSGAWQYTSPSNKPTIVRPCRTPRTNNGSSSSTPATARNTVDYGRVEFYDHSTKEQITAYLYDVWVSANNYGVTCWSDTPLSGIPLAGVAALDNLPGGAKGRIVGYWDVPMWSSSKYSEWKQYYGLYTVPEDQLTTEFAYQSNNLTNLNSGNYLDGVTFSSPGFLSIDKYAKIDNEEVMFVKPGDLITMELYVRNWGEVAVNNISIIDRLSPFNEYIDYAGNVKIYDKNNVPVTPQNIEVPSSGNNHVLTVKLGSGLSLSTGEVIKVTFDVLVREKLASDPTQLQETLLYYFKNQGVVTYADATFPGYSDIVKKNASGEDPLQLFIDPIKLTKTITLLDNNVPVPNAPLIDGPFEVHLKIENKHRNPESFVAEGLINDMIPPGFAITSPIKDSNGQPVAADITNYSDGSTRITIPDVILNSDNLSYDYKYNVEYRGTGYGIFYTSTNTDYGYRYDDGAEILHIMLKFPQPVIGVRSKPMDDDFTAASTGTTDLFILENDNYLEKFYDGGYDVYPTVVLCSSDGTESTKNPDGEYQINGNGYTAALERGENKIKFTPNGVRGTVTIHYKIKLIAAKEGSAQSFDLTSKVAKVTVNVGG